MPSARFGRAGLGISLVWLVFSLLAGCSTMDKMFGSFGGKDNVNPPAELQPFEASARVVRLWTFDAGKGTGRLIRNLRVAVDDTRAYVAGAEGRLSAIDLETGRRIWQRRLEMAPSAGPVVQDGVLLLGGLDGELLVLDADTGEERWWNRLSSEVLALPVVDGNRVIARAQDGRVFGFDLQTGHRVWVYDTSVPLLTLRGNGSPLALAGTVVLGFDDGKVVALRSDDGAVLWEEALSRPAGKTELERLVDIDGQMALIATDLYVAGFQGHAAAMQLTSGQTLWKKPMSSISGLTAGRRHLAVSEAEGRLLLLDRATGETVWSVEALLHRGLTAPAFQQGAVVVGDSLGYLHWLDEESGAFIARERVGRGKIERHLTLDGGVLYVLTGDGQAAAYRLER